MYPSCLAKKGTKVKDNINPLKVALVAYSQADLRMPDFLVRKWKPEARFFSSKVEAGGQIF